MALNGVVLQKNVSLLLVYLLVGSLCSFALVYPYFETSPDHLVIYVNCYAKGANNGTSWRDAYTDLQSALAAAQPGQIIWVAKGIYRPTADLSDLESARAVSFVIPNGIAIYGGFEGTETALDQRDWERNRTILSGDLEDNDRHIDGVVISADGIIGSNTRNLVTISDADQDVVLDGLIITAGQTRASDAEPFQHGAGMRIQNASPTLRNLAFFGNQASYSGGAIANRDNSSPTIINSSFYGNIGYNGGALSNSQSSPVLSQTLFLANRAVNGGAIDNQIQSSLTISSSVFIGNHATTFGGAIYNRNSSPTIFYTSFSGNSAQHRGGAIYNLESRPTISRVSFSDNSARHGGAIYNYTSSPKITAAHFVGNHALESGGALANWWYSSPAISSASFSGNAAQYGGAIRSHTSSIMISNASFAGNSAQYGGALQNSLASVSSVSNTIVWGNSSSVMFDKHSRISFRASLVEGCNSAGIWNSACGIDEGANLADADPLFVSPISHTSAPTDLGNLQLLPESPAIDAGDNSLNLSSTDLDGKPRIIGLAIDLGSYEFAYQSHTGEFANAQPMPNACDDLASSIIKFNLLGLFSTDWSTSNIDERSWQELELYRSILNLDLPIEAEQISC